MIIIFCFITYLGVKKDGQVRHFFHRPSKAYTTGTRKRRKVNSDTIDGGETRWHKTGKTRPIFVSTAGLLLLPDKNKYTVIKGYKKILVLYTNYGRQRKPEKTNWVMHQYHLGNNEDEKDGELVVSKVFYQTQPRQCSSSSTKDHNALIIDSTHCNKSRSNSENNSGFVEYYDTTTTSFISYDNVDSSSRTMIPSLVVNGDGSSQFIRLPSKASKGK